MGEAPTAGVLGGTTTFAGLIAPVDQLTMISGCFIDTRPDLNFDGTTLVGGSPHQKMYFNPH